MTWTIATYHPVSLFSLRPANSTTSGGKTLIAPTPFCIKMALLSASIQTTGVTEGQRRFPQIRDLRIALALPKQVVVVKSFAKIRRPFESKDAKTREQKIAELAEKGQYPFQSTIAYREFVQFGGLLQIAFTAPQGEAPAWLSEMLPVINYLGKRGSFVQIAGWPQLAEALDDTFTEVTRDSTTFSSNGTLQMLDDCGNQMTFEHADIYNPKRMSFGKERVPRHVVLPYRLKQSSRGYSLYERL
ncbi:MAG TPA: hypothetical protein VH540_01165 [Ktedonobacterales bacterium]|jgi:hypothetical protein